MQKWEYLFVNFGFKEDEWRMLSSSDTEQIDLPTERMYEIVNRLGDKGWELVAHNYMTDIETKIEEAVIQVNGVIRMVLKRTKQPTSTSSHTYSGRVY